jgi:hypothetical protein
MAAGRALELLKLFGMDRRGGEPKEPGILVVLLELGGVARALDPRHQGRGYLKLGLTKRKKEEGKKGREKKQQSSIN